MGRNVDDIIAALPKAQRDWIEAKAAQMAHEMIEYADASGETLRAAREASLKIARGHSTGQTKSPRKIATKRK